MPNFNRVRNGGFEQSTPPSVAPFWTGSAGVITETGGSQLLGNNNAFLPAGGNISQPLLPLQAGEIYTFEAAFASNFNTGTIDIEINGVPIHQFQGSHILIDQYGFYNFDFTARQSNATLKITNNTDQPIRIDAVSVRLA